MSAEARTFISNNTHFVIDPSVDRFTIRKHVGRNVTIEGQTQKLLLILGSEPEPNKKIVMPNTTINITDKRPKVLVNGGLDENVKIILKNAAGQPSGVIVIAAGVTVAASAQLIADKVEYN